MLFFPDKNIATVTGVDDSGEELSSIVLEHGMDFDDISRYFPPLPSQEKKGETFNRALLYRSIIYEAFRKQGPSLEKGNVRNFWYTHIKHITTRIIGLSENDSVRSTLNKAWDEVINSGLVTYEGMNIVGGKELTRLSIVKDSPFSNLIVAVEKMDYFEVFNWIPKLFNCTLITAGGQPTRAVARAFMLQLKNLNVNLNQTFYMCTISDLDPAGYYIQEAFRKQFEGALKHYGGTGHIKILRLFVHKDQVTEAFLETEVMPIRSKAKSVSAKKSEETKWRYFCEVTNGGLYLPVPNNWNIDVDGPTYDIDGQKKVKALLEVNAFPKKIIEKAIVQELLAIIEETNDETKIMIPEIMRVFEQMRERAIDDTYDIWLSRLVQPLIDRFLKDTEFWRNDIQQKYYDEDNKAYDKKEEEIKPIDDEYDQLIEEQEEKAREREPELYTKKDQLELRIKELQEELEYTGNEIRVKCSDIFEEIGNLEQQCEEEKKPILEEYNKELANIKLREEYRLSKLKEFEDQETTIFYPLQRALRKDIAERLSPDQIQYFFTDIEKMERFNRHIGRLLVEPGLLLKEEKSCFNHPIPTFNEENLLIRASEKKEENIENVRNRFPEVFTNEMVIFIREHVEDEIFEVTDTIELEDFSGKMQEAIEETENEITEEKWKLDNEEEER